MQEQIITSALEGRDTLAILPTGGGKSICFQVPAMMKEGICIVVSPLIALMKDQVHNLKSRGIPALVVYSGMTAREIDITLDNAAYGDYKFLYVSPERLRTRLFKSRVTKMNVNYLVVDEAHCISQWGHDFRPDYLEIARIREILSQQVPVLAMTATATPEVAADIMSSLRFREPNLISGSFERPNLAYVFRKVEDKMGHLLKVCSNIAGSGIVYVSKRKNAEDLAAFLRAHGIAADCYHAGMPRDSRSTVQDSWIKGTLRVIVSTNAFGMGIDKPDVRFVCHYDMPETPEGYFQEAGRAGRDGKDSYAVLLWNGMDLKRLRQLVRTQYPDLDYIRDIYQKVYIYLGYAYEEGAGAACKFDLEDFAKRFKLHAATAYQAVKYLELSGYWTLTETIHIPSKIQFSVARDQLYRLQLGSEQMDTFIKLLLRMYSGLFTEYVCIDEEKIARMGGYAVLSVRERLKELGRKQVIRYIPAIDSPVLYLANERLVEKNLRLPQKDYDDRVNRHTTRLEAMISMVTDDSECRCLKMYRYFGQKGGGSCGKCDVCLSRKPGARREEEISPEVRDEYEELMEM